jgi:hypothetical protein
VGDREHKETQDQARGAIHLVSESPDAHIRAAVQSITIIPKRNRLRIYIDGTDKYYRLRDLKRVLSQVVVKVRRHGLIMFLFPDSYT